jgi:hypothetical protein
MTTPAPVPERHHHRAALRWGSEIEKDYPGVRYGAVLVLLLVTFAFMASGPTGRWVPLATVVLQGTTLLVALAASEAHRRVVRVSMAVIAVAAVGGIVALFGGDTSSHGYTSVLSFLLVGVGPFVIVQSIVRRRVIDLQTVLGAISIYVFFGMFFAFVFQTIGDLGSGPFFAQQKTASIADYLYFSFVTITTTGYGDLTAAGNFGRAVAVLEALLGQIYLVTIVALLVSRLAGRMRPGPGRGPGAGPET